MARCRTQKRRRGGMSSEDENRFLKEQKDKRKVEVSKLGDEREKGPKVLEAEGMATRKPSDLVHLVDYRTEPAREAAKAGRRRTRRHKRKHSRRRR